MSLLRILIASLLLACNPSDDVPCDAGAREPAWTCDAFELVGPACCSVRLPLVDVAFPWGSKASQMGSGYAVVDMVYRHPFSNEIGTYFASEVSLCSWVSCLDESLDCAGSRRP